MKALTASHT